MTSVPPAVARAIMRLVLFASGATAVTAIVVAAAESRERNPVRAPDQVTRIVAAEGPIAAESHVFRTSARRLAVEPTSGRRRSAHPRTLATYRALRTYSGSPPRIPHGLTPEEYRTGDCATCHERGGFSQRFGAYVPLTPHPEASACLQCHVGAVTLMAIALPRTDPNDRCRQCHEGGGLRWVDSTLDWRGLAPPALRPRRAGRPPPPIPHDRQLREDCLACHSAPGAVAELRTRHPERANCRQCHVDGSGRTG